MSAPGPRSILSWPPVAGIDRVRTSQAVDPIGPALAVELVGLVATTDHIRMLLPASRSSTCSSPQDRGVCSGWEGRVLGVPISMARIWRGRVRVAGSEADTVEG